MSAESRYQSQLFNLILQRSQALTEQWQRNLRQAKVTTLWGMQLGLYPLYLLFQVSRLSQQLLHQGDLQGQRLLRAVADPSQDNLSIDADGPIRKVLAAVQIHLLDPDSETGQLESDDPEPEQPQFLVQVEALSAQRPSIGGRYQKWLQQWAQKNPLHRQATRWLGLTSEPVLQVQGIASYLGDRQLHLVTPENELLDVLTPTQQQQLQQLMTWQIAHFRRQQRLNQSLATMARSGWRDLPLPRTRSQMLPAVQVWRRAMAWMQGGPMASKVNFISRGKSSRNRTNSAGLSGSTGGLSSIFVLTRRLGASP
ncbi:MAG: hypothetical protein HC792_06595 [Acaryochloridaceae cyanobacterium CSU_5_19]|nr:hypothetical protein [Acaryochloridaceae cyanobacterium CSU_5_19]